MSSFQILKSSFSVPQNDFTLSFRSRKRVAWLSNTRRSLKSLVNRNLRVCCKLQENENQTNGEEPPESLFMKELRRRGMTPTSLLEEDNRIKNRDEETNIKEEDGGFWRRNVVSTDPDRSMTNQRDQSMALNSEGLEGLIPRGKLLLTLGGTFFLAFWPLIIVTVLLTGGLYLYFGPTFIHDGTSGPISPPPYIDPYALLEEDRITQIPLH